MIIASEADIQKVPHLGDRRELRNFARFLRLWPLHSFDMINRPRWQKYLGFSDEDVAAMNAAALKKAGLGPHNGTGDT